MNQPVEPKNTPSSLRRALVALKEMGAKVEAMERAQTEPIAIIGIGCRFPAGADTPEAFWELLISGTDATSEIPATRWDVDAYYNPDPDVPGKMYTHRGSFLEEVDNFDPQFFGISPREAESMDPQQRLLLEVSWEALEKAGQAPDKLADTQTGVFVGISTNDFATMLSQSVEYSQIDPYTGTGSAFCVASGRLSYVLGLRGPNLAVDTACSSSLVTVHLACQNLRAGKCNLALAGGVNLLLSPDPMIYLSKVQALSPDGRCKTFDAAADGYGRGEGCGMIVLKRLSDALADGDNIVALIRGSAVNHDGRSSGLTVPNSAAQQELINDALRDAQVELGQVDYVEAHGTGTSLGDPIELRSLAAVLGQNRDKEGPLLVSTVKTNIGHLEAAAGIAGLIKVALMLQHQTIPPHLHLNQPTPHFAWGEIPIEVPTTVVHWSDRKRPYVAGVSSFGLSGTNAHAVLEQAPTPETEGVEFERPLHILSLSARSEPALEDLITRYRGYLANEPAAPIVDICHTANAGRSHFSHRLALIGQSSDQFQEKLAALAAGQSVDGLFKAQARQSNPPQIAFLFTGQGSQYADMGRQLFDTQPIFRQTMEECDQLLHPYLEQSLLTILYSDLGDQSKIDQTAYTQPALFALEYALAQLWLSWGFEPAAVMGHSVGEYVAACVAGIFSLEDGLKLIAERGRLMQTLPKNGAMAVIFASEAQVADVIASFQDEVSIAAINGPENVVISGAKQATQSVLSKLADMGLRTQPLNVSHAFHSPLMDPILDAFEQTARQIQFYAPRIPLVSNLTGRVLGRDEIPDAGYWRAHIRKPVRFSEAIETLDQKDYRIFLEIGPGATLLGMAQRCLSDHVSEDPRYWLPSLRKGRGNWEQMMTSLGELYTLGIDVDWVGFDQNYPRRKAALPTYPFQRERYWFEAAGGAELPRKIPHTLREGKIHPLLGRRLPSALKEIQFESQYSADAIPFLADHKIYEMIVVPGACHMSTLLTAAEEVFGVGPHFLEEITFPQALILPDKEGNTVQVILAPEAPGQASFNLFSQSEGENDGAAWTQHASGRLRSRGAGLPVEAPESPSLDAIRARCHEKSSYSETFYQRLQDAGLQLGPSFRWIEQTWQGDGEALCRMGQPEAIRDADAYALHPGLVDSCFQLLGAALVPNDGMDESELPLYIPIGIDSFRFYSRPDQTLWCHIQLQSGHQLDQETLVGEISLFNENGQIVAEVKGLTLKRAPREALLLTIQPHFKDWLYEINWEEKARSKPIHMEPDGNGKWLIFADQGEVGKTLAGNLHNQGEHCILISPGESFAVLEPDRLWQVNPDDPQDFKRLIEEIVEPERPECSVVYLWGLDGKTGAETEQARICGGALHLVQALAAICDAKSPGLWLVTRGVQQVDSEAITVTVAQAPLWGLGGTIATEYPSLHCRRIDLDPRSEPGASDALFQEIWLRDDEAQVAMRNGARYVARLARSRGLEDASGGQSIIQVQDEGTYLITGGRGGLGLKTAEWLVEQGARHLVLIGRSRDAEITPELGSKFEQAGAEVIYKQADVSQREQLADILAEIKASMHPLKGIVHAAGIIDDGVLTQQTWERFERVLSPKVDGAWNLHMQTMNESLDFFVLYSSMASITGAPAQGNYVAANAFLDALAYLRREHGLHALSINWGPWADVGMAADSDDLSKRRWADMGVSLIPPEKGKQVLDYALRSDQAQLAVTPIDWSVFIRQLHGDRELSLLYNLVDETRRNIQHDSTTLQQAHFIQQFKEAAQAERPQLLETYLQGQAASVLKLIRTELLDPQAPLNQMGLDSLMALELRNRVETDLGMNIPMSYFLQGLSVSEMSALLLEILAKADLTESSLQTSAGAPSLEEPGAHLGDEESTRQLLSNIDQLSNEQVDMLLNDLLAGEEKENV